MLQLGGSDSWKEQRYIGDREGDLLNHIDSYDYEWLDEQPVCIMVDWL